MPTMGQRFIASCLPVLLSVPGVAGAAGPTDSSDLNAIRSGAEAAGYVFADKPRAFEFPRDHGPHPEFRHEWWYLTGNLDSASGERFGFQLTIFRFAMAPLAPAATGAGGAGATGSAGASAAMSVRSGAGGRDPGASAWRTRQVFLAHFAITDVARGRFEFAQKLSRDALGLAGAQTDPFRVWIDDWMLGFPAAAKPMLAGTATSDADPVWALRAHGAGYDLTLDVQSLGQLVLNGDHGLSRKSGEPGAASYYYSIPRVAVRGKVTREGAAPTDVKGLAWLDREWGSGSLGTNQQGWDWFAFQLQDGSALMFYSLRNRDGTRDPHSAGTWVDPAGQVRALSTDQVMIDVSDHWASPRGGLYPSRWRVRIPEVGLDVEVHPALANQELGTKPRYWEGAIDLRGTREGHEATGRGYVELVGYGE